MGALTEDALRGRARPQTHSHGPFHRPAFDVAPSWRLRSPRSKRKLERTPHDVRHSLFVPCSQKGRPSRCILLVGSESVSPAHRPGDTTAQLVGTRRWGSLEAAVEAADHVPEEALRFPLSCFTFRFQLQFTLGSICTSFRCPAKKPENHVLHRVPPHHRHCIFKRPPGPGTVVPDDMQTADRHMERRSAPLITREVQMKTSRDAASSQPEGPSPTNQQTSAGGTWRRGHPVYRRWVYRRGQLLWRTAWRALKKSKLTCLVTWRFLSWIHLQRKPKHLFKRIYAAEATQVPKKSRVGEKAMGHVYNGVLLGHKKQ